MVDDGSEDGTASALARACEQLPLQVIAHRFARGLRETLRDGLEWIADACADDEVVVLTSVEDAADLGALPVMLAALDAGADVAVTSRFPAGARGRHVSRFRRWRSWLPLPWLLGLPGVRDYASSFYAVRGRTLRAALRRYRDELIEPSPWAFVGPLEVLCKLARVGAVFAEVPIIGSAAAPPAAKRAPEGRILRGYADLVRRVWVLDELGRVGTGPGLVAKTPLLRWEWYALAVIMAVALSIRLYALERIPSVVIHDECDNLFNVYQILNGRGPGVFDFDWKPQPAASVYVLSLGMRLGMSIFTLRLPAVLYSVGALLPFFLLARRVLSAGAALLATLLLATDVWYLHFSRSGWENVSTCLFLTAGALCTRDALRSGRTPMSVWAGVWSALGLYGYFSGRAVIAAVLVAGMLSLIRPAIPRRRLLLGLMVTTVTAAALFAPQVPSIVARWDEFQRRSRIVYIFGEQHANAPIGEKVKIAFRSFSRKADELFVGQNTPDRYLDLKNGPLGPPKAVLLAVGLAISVFWLSETWLWWVFLLIPFALTQVLTTGELNGARGVIFVPMLHLFIGLTLHTLWRAFPLVLRPLAAVLVVAGLALSVSTTRQYFGWIQSPALVQDLEPAIPVAEFAEWQAFVLAWTAKTNEFFNVYMWKEHQKLREQLRSGALREGGDPAPRPSQP